MERPDDAGPGAGGRRVAASAAAAEAERRQQLQAFLAAKGKIGQRRGGGAGAKPYLKDWPNRQNLVSSRTAGPTARGQKNVVRAKSREALSTNNHGKLPAGQVPPVRSSCAKAAPSLLPGKAPQQRSSNLPSQRPLGPAAKPARREEATGPLGTGSQGGQMCFLNHRAKREGNKENRGVTGAPPPEKKRAVSWVSLRGPSQATSKEPRKKAHQVPGNIPHRSSQVQISRPAEGLAQGRLRDQPGISQRAPPWAPGAQLSLHSGGIPCVSIPAVDSQGPRAAKPSGSAPVPVKGETLAVGDHLAQCALQGWPLQQQAKSGPAMLAEGRPHRHPLAPLRLPKGSSRPWGGIGLKRSPGRGKKRPPDALRTPRARPKLPATDNPAAVPTGPPTGHGRGLLQSTARRPGGPQSPSPQNRRKQLEEWLASRGKSYKRPPMILLAKKAKKSPEEKPTLNLSFWCRMEEEEEEAHAQLTLANSISRTLTECLKLAEKGSLPEELLASISSIPEVEKFAQFWICKARCLAQEGPFDVARLYEAALRSGAAPVQELRDAMADILKDSNQTPQAAPTQASLLPGEAQADSSPQGQKQDSASKPVSAVKIQVVPLFRANKCGGKLGVQLLTPVRRSLRIERAATSYPQMLKEHHLVVSSLDEIATNDQESHFLFRNNKTLLEGMGIAALLGIPPPGNSPLFAKLGSSVEKNTDTHSCHCPRLEPTTLGFLSCHSCSLRRGSSLLPPEDPKHLPLL